MVQRIFSPSAGSRVEIKQSSIDSNVEQHQGLEIYIVQYLYFECKREGKTREAHP